MRDRTSQPSKNAKGQTPKQEEKKPFNKTSQNIPKVNDGGGRNGKMPGKDKQKDKTPFKKPSDDKRGTSRANMYATKNTSKQQRDMLDFT